MYGGVQAPSLGLTTPKGPVGSAAIRAPSTALSATKQERLEALRNERLRIMQAQASLLARPRSVGRSAAGTPFGQRLTASPGPLHMEELERLKTEIRQLKINEELSKEKIRDLEAALKQIDEKPSDELVRLRQQLSREKERVFTLSSEKQRLEQELQEAKIDKFRTEQLENEVKALKHQVRESTHWREEKDGLNKQIEAYRKEAEQARNQFKTEKSQRLVLAARVEQLEKDLRDVASENIVPPTFERRPTVLAAETVGVIAWKGELSTRNDAGTDYSPKNNHSDEPSTIRKVESYIDPFAAGEDEYIGTPEKHQPAPPVFEDRRTSEISFVDVEQRGSAKKTTGDEVSKPTGSTNPDIASIFGPASPERKPVALPFEQQQPDQDWGGEQHQIPSSWQQGPTGPSPRNQQPVQVHSVPMHSVMKQTIPGRGSPGNSPKVGPVSAFVPQTMPAPAQQSGPFGSFGHAPAPQVNNPFPQQQTAPAPAPQVQPPFQHQQQQQSFQHQQPQQPFQQHSYGHQAPSFSAPTQPTQQHAAFGNRFGQQQPGAFGTQQMGHNGPAVQQHPPSPFGSQQVAHNSSQPPANHMYQQPPHHSQPFGGSANHFQGPQGAHSHTAPSQFAHQQPQSHGVTSQFAPQQPQGQFGHNQFPPQPPQFRQGPPGAPFRY
jgi:hypothetical protein